MKDISVEMLSTALFINQYINHNLLFITTMKSDLNTLYSKKKKFEVVIPKRHGPALINRHNKEPNNDDQLNSVMFIIVICVFVLLLAMAIAYFQRKRKFIRN